MKKILKHLDLWDVKRKPPPRANPRTESFIIYDESSSPSADDPASLLILHCTGAISLLMLRRTGYLIDADYPLETYLLKKSSPGQIGELCPNLPKSPIPPQKIDIDNNDRFRYQIRYWFRLIDASICGATAKADTQSSIFGSSAWKKQLLIFFTSIYCQNNCFS